MGKCRSAAMMQRYYLYYDEGDYMYVCIWCVHAVDACLCWMEGKRECVLWGVLGGVLECPEGDLTLLLSLYAFLKELYSFYLRKRDQPRGKWGQRWETYDNYRKSGEFLHNIIIETEIYMQTEYFVLSLWIKNESRLTKGTNKLSLNCPCHCLDQRGRGETSKQHVVQEDNVEISKPVIPTKVSQ